MVGVFAYLLWYNQCMTISIEKVATALRHSWRDDTCYDASEWTPDNPARGQCVVSSLVINDYFQGDFQKYKVHGDVEETHYCNVLWGGVRVDSTGAQYDGLAVELRPVENNLKNYPTCRAKLLSDEATKARYDLLKSRVSDFLSKE